MRLLVSCSGAPVVVGAAPTQTVGDLKAAIATKTGVPAAQQRLRQGRTELAPDWRVLGDCGVADGAEVQVLLRLLGGMQSGYQIAARLNRAAPANYVAGVGRGAIGFTTRSDIGPARAMPEMQNRSEGGGQGEGDEEGEGKGGSMGHALFADAPYDQEDREADELYAAVEERMDLRRKHRREKVEEQRLAEIRKKRPNLEDQFSDLKSHLARVTPEQWAAIPDIGDHSHKSKKQRTEGFMPVPDSLLDAARKERENTNAVLDDHAMRGGAATPSGAQSAVGGKVADLAAIGKAQTKILGHKLDRAADSVHGQSTVNPRAYMDQMSTLQIASDSDISDYKKARALLKSVRDTNPGHAPAWVASARLEEVAGKIVAAREMIDKGCTACPNSDDVWLEASRLHTPANAKVILARAVRHNPASVQLWLRAADLEGDDQVARRRVLRKALEVIPNSVQLWKASVELETPENAKLLLQRAVECCPGSVDLWLALAKLETHQEARRVLNNARQHIPNDVTIWVTASQLEEANGNVNMCDMIIGKAMESMQKQQVVIDRSEWLRLATDCETGGSPATCEALVKQTIGLNVDDQDKRRTWMEDAESFLQQGFVHTARSVYAQLVDKFAGKKAVWLEAVHLEKRHGTPDAVVDLLVRATRCCPRAEVLWLMRAKEAWLAGDVKLAREVLDQAFAANPDSEQLWLAAVKLEYENNNNESARRLLETARERAGTDRVWMKSVKLERELGNLEQARALSRRALELHPDFHKLWLLASQIEEQLGNNTQARELLLLAVKRCPTSVACWQCLAALDIRRGQLSSARSILEKARTRLPKTPELWISSVQLEKQSGEGMEHVVLAKALQDCPQSGKLLALSVEMAARPEKRAKAKEALQRCDDAHVITALAKVFWMQGLIPKARKWFDRAVKLNPDLGDAWAELYKFEVKEGTEEQQEQVVKRCVEADPHHGEHWCKVAKALENSRLAVDELIVKVALSIQ